MSRRPARMLLVGLNLFLGLTAVAGGIALLVGWINVPLGSPGLDQVTAPADEQGQPRRADRPENVRRRP